MTKLTDAQFLKLFPTARARDAADAAVDAALVGDPYLALVKCCAVWNQAYVDAGGKIGRVR